MRFGDLGAAVTQQCLGQVRVITAVDGRRRCTGRPE